MTPPPTTVLTGATAVAVGEAGLVLRGPSGVGKSALALMLVALGARLVGDDWVRLERGPDGVARLFAPEGRRRGLIEARGLGLLRLEPVDGARLFAVVDVSATVGPRLPPCAVADLSHGVVAPRVAATAGAAAAAALFLWARGGALIDPDADRATDDDEPRATAA